MHQRPIELHSKTQNISTFRVWITARVGKIPELQLRNGCITEMRSAVHQHLFQCKRICLILEGLVVLPAPSIDIHSLFLAFILVQTITTWCKDNHRWSGVIHRNCLTDESSARVRRKEDVLGFPWAQHVIRYDFEKKTMNQQVWHREEWLPCFLSSSFSLYVFATADSHTIKIFFLWYSHGSGIDSHCRHLFVTFAMYYSIMACRWADFEGGPGASSFFRWLFIQGFVFTHFCFSSFSVVVLFLTFFHALQTNPKKHHIIHDP